MGNRKPIPKNVRFEVFKRDSFKCQYCGKSAPDVVLEVDHIVPVAEGGGNDIMNLITSCRDCNRGKSKRKLDDNTTVMKQKRELDELNDRREQLEMMQSWRSELRDLNKQMILTAMNAIIDYTGPLNETLSSLAEDKLRKCIKEFGIQETCEAIDISFSKYHTWNFYSLRDAITKIGGICYNRRKQNQVHTFMVTMSESEYQYFKDWLEAGDVKMEKTYSFTDIYEIISDMYQDECDMVKSYAKQNP